MITAVIIVAAGRGTRAAGAQPKQWQDLNGQSVLGRTLTRFAGVGPIAVVLHPDDRHLWDATGLAADVVVDGGATRDASVRAGLDALTDDPPDFVLIHDAARPLVSTQIIAAVIDALHMHPGAAPALASTDALWTGEAGLVTGTLDRNIVYRAQTPQGFHYNAICDAHRAMQGMPAADDVAIARAAGLHVAMVPGSADNIKLTTAADFDRARQILGTSLDIRVGNGYDVHRFGHGDHVWLCGVKVAHDRGLQGHSDADVGMHAITDAIYGALGQGDIGQHFPPSDPQWKGAQSHLFLTHAVQLAQSAGYAISNIDCTLICEFPKIGPHQTAMKAALAEITGLAANRISVKATTSERLGFTGRGEGIAAMATTALVKS